ncbi:RrF2 family transcriptional regulator [Chlorobium phaeobacteroides]|jgi:Rrf2 family protein|uniref:Transcriptional regulator, BadM/Rrf2 family n=1 Tax=Chlorobium phaeobacteroides (strain DSM 266 / SMG 266 / 2430) TaxID=290317 RepID=A1BDT9_CHLPD|nr:Rrf2 family transcriptional regulator [Chlorobium phaeobacteroides]ABL64566.1 transcriptional regulator, BadM/Rrf2 family [Chlorobium phaeobacteroides DSM 266]MBV5326534.1 Rrf2 family transcriptional regulator [Chlorobium sp.]
MKVLTKNTDYAIRALLFLGARKGSYVSAKTIAAEQEIPYQFLRRLMQDMIGHGLVVSKGGASGGFMLLKEPDGIRINDLIEIFQGKIQVSECMFRKKLCSNRATCVLRHEIMRIEQVVHQEFEKVTIGKLMRDLDEARLRLSGVEPDTQKSMPQHGAENQGGNI